MKKGIIIGSIVLALLLIGGGIFVVAKNGSKKQSQASPSPTTKPKLTIPANTIPVSERPYVMIQPTSAREVVMSMYDLKKKADSVDFELQYSAGDKEEAAIGAIDISGTVPHKKSILLGSKSGGGKITYHENVTGGNLVLSFYNENYKLSNEWAYIDNKDAKDSFSSRDAKFQITTAKLLNTSPFVIVYHNPGLPKDPKKALLAGPYSISGTGELPTGKVQLSMRLTEEKPAEIMGWNGKEWRAFTTKTDGKTATAEVELMQTYVAVEK